MAKSVGKAIRHKTALRLIEGTGAVSDHEFQAKDGLRAYVLADGSYLTEIVDGQSWRLWPSLQVYTTVMQGTVTGRVHDPVLEAVGDPLEFLASRTAACSELLQLTGVAKHSTEPPAALVARVDKAIMRRSGPYWVENRKRLRMLIAFVGEVLCSRYDGEWSHDLDDGVVVRIGARIARIGRTIVSVGDEAPVGAFSVEDVLEECCAGSSTLNGTKTEAHGDIDE